MDKISEKIIELEIMMKKTISFDLKFRFLYLLKDKPLPTKELISALKVDKTNMAHLSKALISEKLCQKTTNLSDKRSNSYSLTEKGQEYINDSLGKIETDFAKIISDNNEYMSLLDNIKKVLNLLSFL